MKALVGIRLQKNEMAVFPREFLLSHYGTVIKALLQYQMTNEYLKRDSGQNWSRVKVNEHDRIACLVCSFFQK